MDVSRVHKLGQMWGGGERRAQLNWLNRYGTEPDVLGFSFQERRGSCGVAISVQFLW